MPFTEHDPYEIAVNYYNALLLGIADAYTDCITILDYATRNRRRNRLGYTATTTMNTPAMNRLQKGKQGFIEDDEFNRLLPNRLRDLMICHGLIHSPLLQDTYARTLREPSPKLATRLLLLGVDEIVEDVLDIHHVCEEDAYRWWEIEGRPPGKSPTDYEPLKIALKAHAKNRLDPNLTFAFIAYGFFLDGYYRKVADLVLAEGNLVDVDDIDCRMA